MVNWTPTPLVPRGPWGDVSSFDEGGLENVGCDEEDDGGDSDCVSVVFSAGGSKADEREGAAGSGAEDASDRDSASGGGKLDTDPTRSLWVLGRCR